MVVELWMKVEEDRTVIQDKTLQGEMEESKQGDGQPVEDRNKRKKRGEDNEMKRRRRQFLIVSFSNLLFAMISFYTYFGCQ